jgi:hypothetical protein
MFLKELVLRLNRTLWGQFLREIRPFKNDPKIGAITGILLMNPPPWYYIGWFRVKPNALFKIYNWDGQTVLFA